MNLYSYCVFRQKIGDVFHFEILCTTEDFKSSSIVGYVLINGKTGSISSSRVRNFPVENTTMEESALKEYNNIKSLFKE